ncbi:MtrB/PioB family decaheme-associated outer membrane protein [Shewanella saliphila]|uniref:Membrane protein n=1 Tax=Shewanella saliphila TaxID=2282698 RepID=A0ABQ2Q6L6_9GAMM|nr:MtrB/PioB family decaheme-associated outer membrane protein [Shewanella saliphila]MCL1101600.1 MtrB/PioB family decaheme-associated outer membrane protein [Shewanella saliphila]GGP50930.1 membrane protein [Shewanella saliphila]
MNTKINLITLALLSSCSFGVLAQGYGLADAKTDSVKFDAWECKRCVVETGTTGSISAGIAYNSEDDIYSANAFNSSNEVSGKVDADIRYRGEEGYQANVDAHNLGMDNGRMDIDVGKQGVYNINVNYRTFAHYESNSALSPYQQIGSDYLTLPDNWETAGSSSDMTMLNSSLNPLELSLNRDRYGMGVEYQSESLLTTYVNFQREEKTGTKTTSGSIYNQSMMLAEPVDYTTDILNAGIKLRGDNWFTSLNYTGSVFKNDNSQLGFDSAFNPTFGAQTSGYMSLDPDNEAHTVSLLGQYNLAKTNLSGRLLVGQMTQDQSLTSIGYGYDLPADSIDAKVDITGVTLKATSRLNREWRVSGSYDYNDRDNKTQIQQWTQISINDVTGEAEYNTPYDLTTHRAKLSADYRITQGIKLDAGYDFERDERSYQDREITDENNLWARVKVNSFDKWNMWFKGSFSQRDGSEYQASETSSTEQNALLRRYYLADRDRSQIEARLSHTPLTDLTVDFGVSYSLDDYTDTKIGLTESTDTYYDVNVHYAVNADVSLNAFYNHQTIESEQSGSSSFSVANWQADIEDTIDYIGAGISYRNLMDSRLKLGLDYTYSDSDSTTQVSQGVTGDYGDYFAKVHNLNLYGEYQATDKMSIRVDYQMENYLDNDESNDISADTIWNVVSFGDVDHDYTAHMVMLSMTYRL